ncbi:baseplate J/gp47 family protein, partial [Escherichia coli]|nr:baseplate J/gp47 family protein [Escherichia coli]
MWAKEVQGINRAWTFQTLERHWNGWRDGGD